MDFEQTGEKFQTTNWTLIEALNSAAHPQHEQAHDLLIRRYWPPIYAAARRMGRSGSEAAEATQAFFVDVVLGRKLFSQAREERGRLRTLLLTALKRHLIDRHRRSVARGGDRRVSLDNLAREERFIDGEPSSEPDEVFERRWAMAVLEEAMSRCEHYFRQNKKPNHWIAFDRFAVRPSVNGVAVPSLDTLATELGYASSVHVSSALKVVRKRLQILLREVAAQTAESPDDQQQEYDLIVRLLG